MEPFQSICHSTFFFLVICRISKISSIEPLECLLSKRYCSNVDFPFPFYKHKNALETLCKRVYLSVQYIFYYKIDLLIDVNKHMAFSLATVTREKMVFCVSSFISSHPRR